jgi:methylglutaconyl-CoA hydratase
VAETRFRHLDVRRQDAVEYLTLNRPEVRNAFNAELIAELTAWAAAAREDAGLRAVVLGGAGASFCAGADVGWMAGTVALGEAENIRDAEAMARMFDAIDSLPCVVVGRVQGAALGGGTGLAAVCDVVVAATDAVFGFTEVRLGILPAVISPFAVAKVGVSAARELFLTGARFTADRARELGLVHRVVEAGGLDAAVAAVVNDVLASAPRAIARAKALVREVAWQAPGSVRELTARAIAAQRISPEGQAGLRAFLDKGVPPWRD